MLQKFWSAKGKGLKVSHISISFIVYEGYLGILRDKNILLGSISALFCQTQLRMVVLINFYLFSCTPLEYVYLYTTSVKN